MRMTNSTALLVSTIAFLSACSSPVKVAETPAPVAPVTQPKPADTRTVAPVVAQEIDPLLDPKGVLAKRSVYFDYDNYAVKPEFTALVQAHAKYLVTHKAQKILIQGNTDERGGREYNIALGQKRSDAVKKVMLTLGVTESQIESVSFGKDKPKANGHDEAAWAENRRADIVYLPK